MLGGILSAVAGPLLGGLFGKKQQAPAAVDGSLSPSQVPAPPAPVPPPPPPKGLADRLRSAGQDFFGAMVDDASRTARSAVFGGIQSRLQGSQRKDYLDAAFPGTTPWEQLGAGAAGANDGYQQMAQQSEELAQRERESKRQSSVTLSTARIQAAQQLAGSFIQNGNYEAAERMLKAAGVFDPALGIDEKMMANGRVASEMRRMDQETRRSQEMLPYDQMESAARSLLADNQSAKVNVERLLAPVQMLLTDWAQTAGEIEIGGLVKGVGLRYRGRVDSMTTGEFYKEIIDDIADEFGSEYADSFQRYLKEFKGRAP